MHGMPHLAFKLMVISVLMGGYRVCGLGSRDNSHNVNDSTSIIAVTA